MTISGMLLQMFKPRGHKRNPGKEHYVTGSGLVHVPEARLTEVPKIIGEFHAFEADRAAQPAKARANQIR